MRKFLNFLIITIILIGISGILIAEEFKEDIKLFEGENIVNISYEFNPIYVADLVKIYPEISTITYNNTEQEVGYVNVFGGIGKNFIVYPNKIYTITASKEVNLNLK